MRSVVRTARLSLVSLGADDLDALASGVRELAGVTTPAGWPSDTPGEVEMLGFFAGRIRAAPELAMWRIRLMVHTASRTMVGHIGFHDAPEDGRLELGYTVLAPHRRLGYASEAIVGLMDAAAADHDVHRFRLAIAPSNAPSLALAERLGFTRAGDQIDEVDGLEWLFERTWPTQIERVPGTIRPDS